MRVDRGNELIGYFRRDLRFTPAGAPKLLWTRMYRYALDTLFQTAEQVALIRMCDDCRVKAQFEAKDNPMALGERRRPKTSEDYVRERDPKPSP